MASVFSKIIAKEIPSYAIKEDDFFYAFLDIFPLKQGHTLVIPKVEIDRFFDVPEEYLARILVFAKPIAKAIEQAFPCDRCGLSVVGLEVPHAHLHLIPIERVSDMNFLAPKSKASEASLRQAQQNIIHHLR